MAGDWASICSPVWLPNLSSLTRPGSGWSLAEGYDSSGENTEEKMVPFEGHVQLIVPIAENILWSWERVMIITCVQHSPPVCQPVHAEGPRWTIGGCHWLNWSRPNVTLSLLGIFIGATRYYHYFSVSWTKENYNRPRQLYLSMCTWRGRENWLREAVRTKKIDKELKREIMTEGERQRDMQGTRRWEVTWLQRGKGTKGGWRRAVYTQGTSQFWCGKV